MLPYEIELILYAASLLTQQANLMPLFYEDNFSIFAISCIFVI